MNSRPAEVGVSTPPSEFCREGAREARREREGFEGRGDGAAEGVCTVAGVPTGALAESIDGRAAERGGTAKEGNCA